MAESDYYAALAFAYEEAGEEIETPSGLEASSSDVWEVAMPTLCGGDAVCQFCRQALDPLAPGVRTTGKQPNLKYQCGYCNKKTVSLSLSLYDVSRFADRRIPGYSSGGPGRVLARGGGLPGSV